MDFRKGINHSPSKSVKDLYNSVSTEVMQEIRPVWEKPSEGKKACYLSIEFLIGRMVYSNLYNLQLLERMKSEFSAAGLDPNMFEEIEDAALGNGGLGRLAACFLDSGATLGKRLDGYCIRYKYGLFKQYFHDGFQQETADDWMRFGDPWSVRREAERVLIKYADQQVWAVPYDMPVIGYGGKTINTLRLWQAEPMKDFDFYYFDKGEYDNAYRERNAADAICSVLYPNDNSYEGCRLRLKQQYFFASATMQSILREFTEKHGRDYTKLPDHYAVQLNDTHPTVAIPELIRLLCEDGVAFPAAFDIAQRTFAYTVHTIMAEALEKWEVYLFRSVVPEVYPYIVMIQNHLKYTMGNQYSKIYAIMDGERIHMARMAIFASHSTNGVARIHTEIMKDDVLREWHELYPERFNNKTNGITQRRWLGLCNPELSRFITDRIGDGWITNLDELKKLEKYANDKASLKQLWEIKQEKKTQLYHHVKVNEYGFELNIDSAFDIQIKRLHEYKRQLLNYLAIMDIYFRLKDGELSDMAPLTCIFGSKSAPGYRRAKGIIKLINEAAKLINADPDVNKKLNVLFVQNYNVSYAEKLVPAADLSEQISTAGTEASGTGNMKLMLNGAVTLGTYDGANIEIVEEAGEENNFIFGARVDDIAAIKDSYCPKTIYAENARIRRVLDTLVDGTFSDGGTGMFRELYDAILEGASWHKADHYYLLLDFEAYVEAKLKAADAWRNWEHFTKMCLMNIANAGKFSSDRTIAEYAGEIWHV